MPFGGCAADACLVAARTRGDAGFAEQTSSPRDCRPPRGELGAEQPPRQCERGEDPKTRTGTPPADASPKSRVHGLIAPAATDLGRTLALFTDLLPANQRPVRDGADQIWNGPPPDPRGTLRPDLKIVSDTKRP